MSHINNDNHRNNNNNRNRENREIKLISNQNQSVINLFAKNNKNHNTYFEQSQSS